MQLWGEVRREGWRFAQACADAGALVTLIRIEEPRPMAGPPVPEPPESLHGCRDITYIKTAEPLMEALNEIDAALNRLLLDVNTDVRLADIPGADAPVPLSI